MTTKDKDIVNLGSPEVIATSIIFSCIAASAVLLRVIAKRTTKARWGWDDWWIVLGLIFFVIEAMMEIGATEGIRLAPTNFVKFTELEYAAAMFYFPGSLSTKLSILYLYRRIFPVPNFKLASSIVIVICVLWALGCGIAQIFMCNPPQKLWHPEMKGYCFQYGKYLVAALSFEITIDALILSLPVYWIVGMLQLSAWRKAQVIGIFLLGGFVVMTNIIRVVKSYDPVTDSDVDWEDQLWYNIHAGTAILCACLPTYKPILNKAAAMTSQWSQSSSKNPASKPSAASSSAAAGVSADKRSHYNRMGESNNESETHLAREMRGTGRSQPSFDQEVPLESIQVKHDEGLV